MPTWVGEVVPKQHWGIYAKRAEQIDAKGNLEIYAQKNWKAWEFMPHGVGKIMPRGVRKVCQMSLEEPQESLGN